MDVGAPQGLVQSPTFYNGTKNILTFSHLSQYMKCIIDPIGYPFAVLAMGPWSWFEMLLYVIDYFFHSQKKYSVSMAFVLKTV